MCRFAKSLLPLFGMRVQLSTVLASVQHKLSALGYYRGDDEAHNPFGVGREQPAYNQTW